MLARNITRISSIDSTIEELHSKLKDLYEERSHLMSSQANAKGQVSDSSSFDLESIDLTIDSTTGLRLGRK